MTPKKKNSKTRPDQIGATGPKFDMSKQRPSRSAGTPESWFAKKWVMVLGMNGLPALLALIIYANVLGNELIYDDTWTIGGLSSDISLRGVLQLRGFTYLIHRLDVLVWQSWTPGFHLTNLLLHALASALAASAAFAISKSRGIGLLCGLFFAVHPVHTEVVASVAYRKDILAAIFVFLALILWLSVRFRFLSYVGSFVCFGIALISKEVAAVALPAMLFLADLLPKPERYASFSQRLRKATLRVAPFVIIGLVLIPYLSVDFSTVFTPERVQKITENKCKNYGEVLATAAASVPTHMRLMSYPVKLSADYHVQSQKSIAAQRSVIGLLMAAAWIFAALLLLKRTPEASFAIIWTVIMFLPCSNVVPLIHFFVADRYLYVPSFGFCLLLAIGVRGIFVFAERRGLGWLRLSILGVVAFMLVVVSVRSVVRIRDWRDDYSLWSSAVRDGFNTCRVHNNLAAACSKEGDVNSAIKHYSEAIRIDPSYVKTHLNLGDVLGKQGRFDEAVKHYSDAIRLDPEYAEAHNNLGTVYASQGKLDEAIEHYSEALRINPDLKSTHNNLGTAFSEKGKFDQAIEHYSEALRIDPEYAEAHNNLGTALAKQGKFDEAIEHFSEALRIDPTHTRARENLKNVRQLQSRK